MERHDDKERDLARSPAATPSELRGLASKHPDEVLANAALPLLALEDPALYEEIYFRARRERARRVLRSEPSRLGEERRRLFAADCAERALPLFERSHPTDERPRSAIAVARRLARGEATEVARRAARDEARAAVTAAYNAARSAGASVYAARAAANALSPEPTSHISGAPAYAISAVTLADGEAAGVAEI